MARKTILCGSIALSAFVLCGDLRAQDDAQRKSFDIPSAAATRAIPEFARQAGIQIVALGNDLQDIRLPELKGHYDVRAALRSLIAGTNLQIVSDNGGTIVLRIAPDKSTGAERRRAAVPPAPTPSGAEDALQPVLANSIDEIVVTGTHIVRYGYTGPTPITVITTEMMESQSGSGNIADVINTMPVFAGSTTPVTTTGGPSFGTGGVNTLNLRNLGVTRTLILLDGQRVVPVLSNGTVDVNNFPQALVSRVDVVTGGAAAVYGSDAVAGVVNFVLDKTFVGVKGEVSGGITGYGDDQNWLASISGGAAFANDRGHLLLSGQIEHRDGVLIGAGGRKWSYANVGLVENPAYTATCGCPEIVTRPNVYLDNATHGGIILSGPLKGTAFGQGGAPYQFHYGTLVAGDPFMQGGDWQSTLTVDQADSLDPSVTRQNAFVRASYDVTDDVNVYAQASWGATTTVANAFAHYQAGSGPVIQSGNPFIPASIQRQMTALGLTSFQIGTMNWDMGAVWYHVVRAVNRYSLGATGKTDVFSTMWSWNAYATYGYARTSFSDNNVEDRAKLSQAEDAVIDPRTGGIVCRVTLTVPTSGCQPWNPLGVGVNDPDGPAKKWIFGSGFTNEHIGQSSVGASATGEPFSNWAGPISFALDAEWRRDSALGKPNATSVAGGWRSGNFGPIDAHREVLEGAGEAVVPLAKQTAWAEALDVSVAVRATDYSYSGYVTTWKVGSTYRPISDVLLRATRSRDIRAPNLNELFGLGNQGFGSSFDPFTNTSATYLRPVVGNTRLQPEKANTTDLGMVVQPRFLPDFSFSVDYWNIDLTGSIAMIGTDTVLLLCYQGQRQFCDNITRTNGAVTQIALSYFNLAAQTTRGIDFESRYRFSLTDIDPAWAGEVALRGNATVNLKNYINDGLSPPTNDVGTARFGAAPYWRLSASATYTYDALQASLTARAFSAGHLNNTWIECTSGCPPTTAANPTIDSNRAPGALYFDSSVSYAFQASDAHLQAFFNIKNLLDRAPGYEPMRGFGLPYNAFPTDSMYDELGRVFRVGIRFAL